MLFRSNNVGASLKLNSDCTADELMQLLQLNLVSAFIFTKYISASMVSRGEGGIITIGTMATVTDSGLLPYIITKSALDGLVKKSSYDLVGTRIWHVGIRPGPLDLPNRYLTDLSNSDPNAFLMWCNQNDYRPKRLISYELVCNLVNYLVENNNYDLNGNFFNCGGGI